ncbi:MAG: ribosome maturation factor RimP [Oscillospiraceae bacterium]|nr:ribosome maturation factor RimP [Oscillospiraceae bacterium]
MSDNKKGGNIASRVWGLAEPAAGKLGLLLWDVRFVKEGGNYYLRIFIDKEGGVGIDDCVDMSRAVDAPLDELDIIEQGYSLQVSSPGAERELIRDGHFISFIGSDIKIKLHKARNDRKEYSGVLKSYDSGDFIMAFENGEEISLNKKECAFIKLDDLNKFFNA